MVSSTGQEAERTSQHRLCDLKQVVRSDFLLPRLYSVKVSHEAAVELVSRSVVCNSFVTLWTVGCQAPLSVEFPRQDDSSGLPFFPPGDLPDPGTEPRPPVLQTDIFSI